MSMFFRTKSFNVCPIAGVRKVPDGESLKRESAERITPVLMDVTDATCIIQAANDVAAAVGDEGLSGLVNNAGIVRDEEARAAVKDRIAAFVAEQGFDVKGVILSPIRAGRERGISYVCILA